MFVFFSFFIYWFFHKTNIQAKKRAQINYLKNVFPVRRLTAYWLDKYRSNFLIRRKKLRRKWKLRIFMHFIPDPDDERVKESTYVLFGTTWNWWKNAHAFSIADWKMCAKKHMCWQKFIIYFHVLCIYIKVGIYNNVYECGIERKIDKSNS